MTTAEARERLRAKLVMAHYHWFIANLMGDKKGMRKAAADERLLRDGILGLAG